MAVRHLSDVVKIGADVLRTTLSSATGFITAQLGNVVTEQAHSPAAEWFFPPGFAGRVAAPVAGKRAAQVVAITRSDNDAIVGCRDERDQAILSSLADGETAVYSPTGKGVAYFRADGSVAIQNGSGTASATINADGTVNVYGTAVAIGDGTAAPLAHSTETVTALTALAAVCTSLGSLLSTPPTSVVFAAYAPVAGPLFTGLSTSISAVLATLPTTKAKGT